MNSKNWVNRLIGASGKVFEKQILSAANSGQIDVGIIADGPVIVNTVIISSNGPTTVDLVSASITSGPSLTPLVNTYIDGPTDGLRQNIDAERKQVGWTGVNYLKSGDKVVIDLNGVGPTNVDFDVVLRYTPTNTNGKII